MVRQSQVCKKLDYLSPNVSFHNYTQSLFRKAYRKTIKEDDLYEVLSTYKSQKLGDDLENCFRNDKETHPKPSIYRILWKCYGFHYLCIGIVQLFARSISVITIPLILGKLVSYFLNGQTNISKNEAFIYAFLVIGLNLLNCLYLHNYMLLITGLGIRVRTAFSSIIYRKALKLSPSALSKITSGKITTAIQKDVKAFQEIIRFGNDVWIGFAQAAIVCYLIYVKMGVAAFSGFGTFLIVLPLQIYIGKAAKTYRTQINKSSDKRYQITKEALSAIKLIKIYTWENYFLKKIEEARRREIQEIVKLFLVKVIIILLGALTSKMAFYLLLMTHIWTGNFASAENIYFILSAFQKLRQSFSVIIPQGITQSGELHASVKRIETILMADEIDKSPNLTNEKIKSEPKIMLDNVFLNKEKLLNNKINITTPGLTILTGANASGKTALLNMILGNLSPTSGSVSINGTISYTSQEPWVFPSTIKQNILFGQKLDPLRYQQTLKVCAIENDLEDLSKGDRTIVGDQGINLSKGQLSRINLARAVYKDSDVYLLDDCLASLDPQVQEYVFVNCIKGFLKHKITILVTLNPKYFSKGDQFLEVGNEILTKKDLKHEETNVFSNIGYLSRNPDIDSNKIISEETEEEDKLIEKSDSKKTNIYSDPKKFGNVSESCYKTYIEFGGFFVFGIVMTLFVLTQCSKSYTDRYISSWVNMEQNISQNQSNFKDHSTAFKDFFKTHWNMSITFSILMVATTVLSTLTALGFFIFTKKASKELHYRMMSTVLNARMAFFEKHFLGNIINKFSRDLSIVDEDIPFVVYELIEFLLTICGIMILISVTNVIFLIPEIAILAILCIVRHYYLPAGRDLQRLDTATRSPLIGHLNASLDGLTTIRAFGAQDILCSEFDRHQDLNTSASYTSECCARAFGFVLDMICCAFISIVVLRFLLNSSDSTVGDVGLAITQSMMLTGLFQYSIRKWADLENKMTSVERSLEYTKIPKENFTGSIIENWPKAGEIKYDRVCFSVNGDKILNNVSFTINPGEKIGVVGRTGAGKTSLFSTLLFRLYDYEGTISIDNVNIKTLTLDYLRKNIGIIPQDPVLFSGTIRTNIDPIGKYTDSEIQQSLANFEMTYITSLNQILDASVLSAGQKQLLCFLRVFKGNYKTLILDEATSITDQTTDDLVVNSIKDNFRICTVIIIAHKLKTVLDLDRVMIIDKGELIEFDTPETLLKNKESVFFKMVQEAGIMPQ